jgi:prepilin-type N-terminal cleavage/methylation domain-containing protein
MKKLRLNSQVRRTLQGGSRGFTFIEVLLAIAILGVISIAFMSALSTASTVLFIGDERTTAESLARRQLEYVKSQGYKADSIINGVVISAPIYQKIGGIPEGYSLWSVNRTGGIVEEITGIPWDSQNNMPAATDKGLQKIALVIIHKDEMNQDKVIYTFINDNSNWADGVEIILEGYKVDR